MAPEPEPPMEGAPPWITTFVDMTSLLVTFFILLFTFSSIKEHDTFSIIERNIGLSGTLNSNKGRDPVDPPEQDTMFAMDIKRGANNPHVRPPDKLPEDLENMGQKLTENHLELDPGNVDDGLVLHFGTEATFEPGSARVGSALRQSLIELGEVMQHYPNLLVLEGHTDSEFQRTPAFPTAEALATARAESAARVLIEQTGISPKLIQIASYGANSPITDNSTPSLRRENRRVDVRIVSLSAGRAAAIEEEP